MPFADGKRSTVQNTAGNLMSSQVQSFPLEDHNGLFKVMALLLPLPLILVFLPPGGFVLVGDELCNSQVVTCAQGLWQQRAGIPCM